VRVVPFLLCLGLSGCDSTALSLEDPNLLEVAFEPAFFSPDDRGTVDVEVTFLGVTDPDDDRGVVRDLEEDFTDCAAKEEPCTAIFIDHIEFLSNWRVRLSLEVPLAGSDQGRYDLRLRVTNAFGTFTGVGAFFVFR